MSEYEKQAMEFAEKYGVKLEIEGCDYKKMRTWGDDQERWVYLCELSRGVERYRFSFGQSLAAGKKEPTMYEVLACMTKYDVGTFEEFCREYGYDSLPLWEYPRINFVYGLCCQEYKAMCRLFPEEEAMEELCEIA